MSIAQDVDRFLSKFRRLQGFVMTEEGLAGVSVKRLAGGRWFAHLLAHPESGRGWLTPIEPVRFFARRTVIPSEFKGRELDYIRYNQPELVPLPQTESILMRLSRIGGTGEALLHGIRRSRLEEVLESRRSAGKLPHLEGVVPPSVALASLLQVLRPGFSGKTLSILIGTRTTRYVGFRDGMMVSVFDDVHRPDLKDFRSRFRKTLQRVLGYMEAEGFGSAPDRIVLLGSNALKSWEDELRRDTKGQVVFMDVMGEVGLTIPENQSVEIAILALGAAFCARAASSVDANFISVPKELAARRFDAYDLVIYGSLAVCLALSFVTLNVFTADRIRGLKLVLQTNSQRIRVLRDDVESKRGIVPMAKKLLSISAQRLESSDRVGRRVMDSLPQFFAILSETIPDGVQLDRVGSGDADMGESSQAYKSILSKAVGQNRVTLIGQTRSPEKAMLWVDRLSKSLDMSAVMEEMKVEPGSGAYRFRIALSSKGDKGHA